MSAPAWLLLAPLAWACLWLLERWQRRPLRVIVADLSVFGADDEDAAPAQADRRPSQAFWWRAAACAALAGAAAGPEWTTEARLDVDLVLDRGVESGFVVDGASSLDWHRGQLERVLDSLRPDDRVHLGLIPERGGVPPLSPADARRVLAGVRAVGAQGDVAQALGALSGRRPAFVAGPRVPQRTGISRASWAQRGPNRGIAQVAVGESGVEVSLVGVDLPGACGLELTITAGGAEHTKRVAVELPSRGSALARWPRSEWPFDAAPERVAARLLEPDALPLDDQGFALRERRVRIGLASDPGPAVERALRAVPGTEVVRVRGAAADYDLVVVDHLAGDAPLPATAVVVVPARGVAAPSQTVRAVVDPAGAFRHTVDAVFAAPFSVTDRAPLPSLQGAHAVLQTADGEPLVVVRGRGSSLVAALGVPPRRQSTSWVASRAFPFFWAELVALAADERGQVRSRVAGTVGGERPFLEVGVFPADAPRVGTVAAPLGRVSAGVAQPFTEEALAGLAAARPRTATPWGWLLFGVAFALGVVSMRSPRQETR